MKERPIIFSAPMVHAILAGTKSQTRRMIKPQPDLSILKPNIDLEYRTRLDGEFRTNHVLCCSNGLPVYQYLCPHGQVGDRLWVRETYFSEVAGDKNFPVWYRATEEKTFPYKSAWKPSIYMPRWASRILLEITDVRVERLQDISEDDAKSEGLRYTSKDSGKTWKYGIADADGQPGTDNTGWAWNQWNVSPTKAYSTLWNKIHGPDSWDKNPWVWVIEFKRMQL